MIPPTGSLEFSGSSVISQQEISIGHGFDIYARADDAESGIQSALLYRDNVLINAMFDKGLSIHNENPLLSIGDVNYRWSVTDYGQNTKNIDHNVAVISDAPPVITYVSLRDSSNKLITSLRENSHFQVILRVADDVGLSRLEVQFGNQKLTRSLSGKLGSENFTFYDNRVTRVVEGQTDTVKISVFDNAGQVVTVDYDVVMQVDTIPDMTKGSIDYPEVAYYSTSDQYTAKTKVTVNHVNTIDDSEIVNFYVMNYNSNYGSPDQYNMNDALAHQEFDRTASCSSSNCLKRLSFTSPQTGLTNDQAQFVVIVEDALQQRDISEPFTIQYSFKPNKVQFNNNADILINKSTVDVDNDAVYRVQVTDSANRTVGKQLISWTLITLSGDGPDSRNLGRSITELDGTTQLTLATALPMGRYRLEAKLSAHSTVSPAAHGIEVLSGQVQSIEIMHIHPVIVAEAFTVSVRAYDRGHNVVNAPSDLPLIVTLPTQDFHFGFSGNGQVSNAEHNGQLVEKMTTSFVAGEVNISASAGLNSGRFLLPIEYAAARLLYDHDGRENTEPKDVTEIPVELLPAKPQAVVITLADKTNHQYGRDTILEAGEKQQLVLTLEDRYGNRAIRWENQDTNILLSASVNGDAIILSLMTVQKPLY
jgi:hypothetical protein